MPLRPVTEQTCQRAIREVEFCDIVAKLANVRWKCEALVAAESNVDSVCLHADNIEGQLACVRVRKHHCNF